MTKSKNAYYAHSENRLGEKHLLSDHLKQTAEIALDFGNSEAVKSILKIVGLLHDLGKYQQEFQLYLEKGGRRGSVPHSVWGAGFARLNNMNEISWVIDGHHKGLPDRAHWKIDTDVFKGNKVSDFEPVFKNFLEDISVFQEQLQYLRTSNFKGLQKEILMRYIFSALVDADWLNTESHFDPDKTSSRINKILDVTYLIEKLESEFANKSKEGEINKLRNQLRARALEKAQMGKGFYSLNLPTGMGKTLTSFVWALHHAKANNLKRIIIVLPYISIIDQTAAELKRIFGDECILEHHSNYNENDAERNNYDAHLDIVEERKKLATENWDYPVIVTTTVQFFESLFSNKPSKCRKNHNIAESVVIFDEVQSLPKELILPTLTMLKNIKIVMGASFLFCTATQPAFEKRDRFDGIESIYPLIENPLEIFKKTKRVNYQFWRDLKKSNMDELVEAVKNNNSSVLVMFNTKRAVREFFDFVNRDQCSYKKCYHLSTSMCPDHRKKVIEEIREDLKNKCKILVASTQLIEAGVDFDFPCVFREMAPLESIIQSAGRCNREGKLNGLGEVYLFQLETSGMPDKTYKACAEHARGLIQQDIKKLYHYNFFQEYYLQVLNLFVNADKNNILNAQEKFNFETVSKSYHLISEKTEGIYIYNYSEESRKLFHKIEHKEFLSRNDFRMMQAFTVQVYPNFLFKNSNMCKRMPQNFLVWYGNYDSKTGISVEPMVADKMVV